MRESEGSAITLYGPAPTFTFDQSGTYDVSLTVKDVMGYTSMDTVRVEVTVPAAEEEGLGASLPWLVAIILLLVIVAILLMLYLRERRKGTSEEEKEEERAEEEEEDEKEEDDKWEEELDFESEEEEMQRIG